jgi:hypothetical protein
MMAAWIWRRAEANQTSLKPSGYPPLKARRTAERNQAWPPSKRVARMPPHRDVDARKGERYREDGDVVGRRQVAESVRLGRIGGRNEAHEVGPRDEVQRHRMVRQCREHSTSEPEILERSIRRTGQMPTTADRQMIGLRKALSGQRPRVSGALLVRPAPS